MRALSIRQPYAELILRGIKTIEYRSRATRIVGERFLIYASRQWAGRGNGGMIEWGNDAMEEPAEQRPTHSIIPSSIHSSSPVLSDNLEPSAPPPWMVELANGLRLFGRDLPTGVIVGSAVITAVTRRHDGMYEWRLADVRRAKRLRKPRGRPQPVWFLE